MNLATAMTFNNDGDQLPVCEFHREQATKDGFGTRPVGDSVVQCEWCNNLLKKAGESWMRNHGECPQHHLVEASHRCRDYDGQVFSPSGYGSQGYERAQKYLVS